MRRCCGDRPFSLARYRLLLGDDTTRDTIAGVAGRGAAVIVWLCVQDERGAVSVEQSVLPRKAHPFGKYLHVEPSAGWNLHVRQISFMRALVVHDSVRHVGGIEMRSGGLKRRCLALANTVDM